MENYKKEIKELFKEFQQNKLRFQSIIKNKNKVKDEMLFEILESKSPDIPVKEVFVELFMNRYLNHIQKLCFITSKKYNFDECEFTSFALEEIEKSISKNLFKNFIVKNNFKEDFKRYIAGHISKNIKKRYLNLEFRFSPHQLSKKDEDFLLEDNIDKISKDKKFYVKMSAPSLIPENIIKEIISSKIISSEGLNKKILFLLFCKFITTLVRENVGDKNIHDKTKNGVEKNRKFDLCLNILQNACLENQENLAKIKDKEFKLNEILSIKKNHLGEIKNIVKNINFAVNANKKIEEIKKLQRKYEKRENQKLLIERQLAAFMNLSHKTIAHILNTTESNCYKYKSQFKKEYKGLEI